ncbi:PIG-X [Lophiotrema nucula]|uniref:Protein PBN1 n=1 Tax=Lophiotrema nucula TaxID=690887 RepID=A0A6A5Z6K2_9PLEO|nr:PIG-X [Lophiotrema nucula]
MKQRITYIVKDADDFDPEQLDVKSGSLTLKNVKAAKEHRITFGLSELPRELQRSFQQWHELHIRWASETPYSASPPFTARVSPGLHAFFTPLKDRSEGSLCPLLQEIFGHGLICEDPKDTFIKLPVLSERFSMSAASEYYAYVPNLSNFVSYVQKKLCPPAPSSCKLGAASLSSASYLDIDYDTISHAVIVNAFWSEATWKETISLTKKEETIEVGVLNHESRPDPEDIGFGGFLTVLGNDDEPKPTRFQTATRHYPLVSSPLIYRTRFSHPTGLHPTLILTLPSSHLDAPDPTCKLHTHLTLPSYLFIDKYQFNDPLFLASKNLVSLRSLSGATDLEAPDWVVPQWGSAALFELAVPSFSPNEDEPKPSGDWNVSIPMHLRYLPAQQSSHTSVPVPWPVVFWACRAEEGAKMAVNPFDRIHLGYEGLFGLKTRFMHVPPAQVGNGTGRLVEWIDVPVLDLRKTGWVEAGTVGTVIVAFLGLCWVLFGGLGGSKKGKESEKKTQ